MSEHQRQSTDFQLPQVGACHYFNEDFGLDKIFRIRGIERIVFGVMFANIFSRHHLVSLTGNRDNAAFGQFTAATFPRTVQFNMKVEF